MARLSTALKHLVSDDRNRFVSGSFDLDLSYITPRIVAMGFPASGLEGVYRNNIDDVERFLHELHKDHFFVFNLSGKDYDYAKFGNAVLEFGWPDHHSPPLHLLYKTCTSIDSWLKDSPQNVAVVHCMAGKGRTGTVISSYLLWSGECATPQAAMDLFARERSGKGLGIGFPSQKRMVNYFAQSIAATRTVVPSSPDVVLSRLVIHGLDLPATGTGPLLYITSAPVESAFGGEEKEVVFRTVLTTVNAVKDNVVVNVGRLCAGDLLVRCYGAGTNTLTFYFAIHTLFLPNNLTIRLAKEDIDLCHKDTRHKLFPEDFWVECVFEQPQEGCDYRSDRALQIEKEGWMEKLGNGLINTGYKRRWFSLKDNVLSYAKEKAGKEIGAINLMGASLDLYRDGGQRHPGFSISVPGRVYIILPSNEEETERWMAAILQSMALQVSAAGFTTEYDTDLTDLASFRSEDGGQCFDSVCSAPDSPGTSTGEVPQ